MVNVVSVVFNYVITVLYQNRQPQNVHFVVSFMYLNQ